MIFCVKRAVGCLHINDQGDGWDTPNMSGIIEPRTCSANKIDGWNFFWPCWTKRLPLVLLVSPWVQIEWKHSLPHVVYPKSERCVFPLTSEVSSNKTWWIGLERPPLDPLSRFLSVLFEMTFPWLLVAKSCASWDESSSVLRRFHLSPPPLSWTACP